MFLISYSVFITAEGNTWIFSQSTVFHCCIWGLVWFGFFKGPYTSSFIIQQATELAEYTAKIALLEEARKRKESEVEEWQIRVSIAVLQSGSEVLHSSGAQRSA